MSRQSHSQGSTPLYWYSANIQAFNDWMESRKHIMAMNPLQLAAEKAKLLSGNQVQIRGSIEGDYKPAFGDGSQDYMMTRYKNLALINISGTLVASDNWYNRYYGMISYAEIRRSILMALEDKAVTGILATMNTPGGNASGADAMATFFKKTDQSKPFYVFAETEMCSGGYYLGAPAREVYAQRASLIGSIGVIMVHMDILNMYEEMGIKPTVFRAGEFKALGSPYEHLDKKAQGVIQSTLGNYFDMFNDHVVDCRSYSNVADFRATAGEGRVFMAEEAKEVGLVDQVAEMEEALDEVSQKSNRISGKSSQFAVTSNLKGTKLMSYAQLLALAASGVQLTAEQQAILDAGDPDAPAVEAEAGDNVVEDPTKPVVEATTEPVVEEPAPAAPAVAASADLNKVIELSTELGQAKATVTKLEGDLSKLQTELDASKATMSSLQAIVCQAISHRQVALGYQPSPAEDMTAGQQVELFNKLDADFKERFKAGQVSKPTSAQPSASATLSPTPVVEAVRNLTGKL